MRFFKKNWYLIFTILIVVIILLYFCVSFFSEQIVWQYAERYTYYETRSFDAVMVRDEQPIISSNSQKNRYYCCANGEKVAKGKTVVQYFSSADVVINKRKIAELESKSSKLKKMDEQNAYYKSDEKSNASQIMSSIYDIANCFDKKMFLELPDKKEQLEGQLNLRALIRGERENYKDIIDKYQSELSNLKSSSLDTTGEDIAPEAGYFLNYTDGHETEIDYANALKLNKVPEIKDVEQKQNTVGKIVKSAKSYIVFEAGEDDGKKLSNKDVVDIKLPTFSEKITVAVEAVNKSANGYVAVLSTMSENVMTLSARQLNVHLYFDEYSGLKVDSKALRKNKNESGKEETGVYIQIGNQVKYRKADVSYYGNDFVIVKEGGELKVKDEVIIGGINIGERTD